MLITNWNSRVREYDTVLHLGDFCFKNSAGGKEGEGEREHSNSWRGKLVGNIVFIKGNHDRNNSLKTPITHLVLDFGGKLILCQHHPIEHPLEIPEFIDLVLCGHVHEKWFGRNVEGTPMINVGVDRHDFYPWKLDELLYWADQIEKHGDI